MVTKKVSPLKKGVLELIPDSFAKSSRTSLSSAWFTRATPDNRERDSQFEPDFPLDFGRFWSRLSVQ